MGIDIDVLRCYTVPTVEGRSTEKASTICSTIFHLFGQRRLSLLHIKKKRTAPPVLFFLRFCFPFFASRVDGRAAFVVSNLCKQQVASIPQNRTKQFFCRLLQNRKSKNFERLFGQRIARNNGLFTFCQLETHCKTKKQAQKKTSLGQRLFLSIDTKPKLSFVAFAIISATVWIFRGNLRPRCIWAVPWALRCR